MHADLIGDGQNSSGEFASGFVENRQACWIALIGEAGDQWREIGKNRTRVGAMIDKRNELEWLLEAPQPKNLGEQLLARATPICRLGSAAQGT